MLAWNSLGANVMKRLSKNWFFEGLVDFEYKQYQLLDYFQEVQKHFSRVELYPPFSDLIFHYENLNDYLSGKQSLSQKFPKSISGLDPEAGKIVYEEVSEEGPVLEEVESIISYSIPLFQRHLEEGKEIYELIASNIDISSVGLLPLYRDEGYLLLLQGQQAEVKAFQYQISIFKNAGDQFRSIRTEYIHTFPWTISKSFESIKQELIRYHQVLPNPATFRILSEMEVPEKAAFLPVAKRKFLRHLASEAL